MLSNLLPPGFRDDLSPITEQEHLFTNKIIKIFNSNGYKITKPPIIEFLNKEDNKNIFLISNKKEKRTLKVRNDITMQIARIASSRFKEYSRPLRLCYYGEVVRNISSILRPERQFLQVGAECIGDKSFLADAEILILAFQSLKSVGIKNISVDLSNPIFLKSIKSKDLKNSNKDEFIKYLMRKDVDMALSFIKNKKKKDFIKNLIACRGNLKKNIYLLKKLNINKDFSAQTRIIIKIYNILKDKFNDITFNLDFTDKKSLDYYSGLNFTIFAKNVRGEIASGGRYINRFKKDESGTGFACYMDTIVRASSYHIKQKKIIVPFDTPEKIILSLLKRKFVIERSFSRNKNLLGLAKKKKYSYLLINNKVKKIKYA